MTKETMALIHLNNILNDLSTTISKSTNDGVSTKLFNQLIEDISNIVKDNSEISNSFKASFIKMIHSLNTDVNGSSEQSQALSKLVMFNSKYMSNQK